MDIEKFITKFIRLENLPWLVIGVYATAVVLFMVGVHILALVMRMSRKDIPAKAVAKEKDEKRDFVKAFSGRMRLEEQKSNVRSRLSRRT